MGSMIYLVISNLYITFRAIKTEIKFSNKKFVVWMYDNFLNYAIVIIVSSINANAHLIIESYVTTSCIYYNFFLL